MQNNQYDVIILGSGITEASLAALLSVCENKRVLLIDRKRFLGAENSTLPIHRFEHMHTITDKSQRDKLEKLKSKAGGKGSWKWRLTMSNKIIFTESKLVKILLKTRAHEGIHWQTVDSSFCFKNREESFFETGRLMFQVPVLKDDGMYTDLTNIFEKRRVHVILDEVIRKWKRKEEYEKDLTVQSYMRDKEIPFESQRFLTHSLALIPDEKADFYPMQRFAQKLMLYRRSMMSKFGHSPWIYPENGLAEVYEAFCSQVSAHGNGSIEMRTEIEQVMVEEKQNRRMVSGVRTEKGEVFKAPVIICDPSYVGKEQVIEKYSVIRCMCIVNHKFMDERLEEYLDDEVKGYESGLIILPYGLFNRQTNIYLTFFSSQHKMAPKYRIDPQPRKSQFHFVVSISAVREKEEVAAEEEIQEALKLLKGYDFCHIEVLPRYKARQENGKQKVDQDFIYLDPEFEMRQKILVRNYKSYERRVQAIQERRRKKTEESKKVEEKSKNEMFDQIYNKEVFNINDYNQVCGDERTCMIHSILSDEEDPDGSESSDSEDENEDFTINSEDYFEKLRKEMEEKEIKEFEGLPEVENTLVEVDMKEPSHLTRDEPNFKHIQGLYVTDSPSFLPHFEAEMENCLHIFGKISGKDVSAELEAL